MTYGCEDVEIVRNPDPDARSRGAKLAFYVTSHGFGHLNRTVAVINHVPADLPVVIRSHPNLFPHWRERLTRPAELTGHVSDAGAVNPPGDSTATDGPATLELAARVHAEAMARVDEEARWLRDAARRGPAVRCPGRPPGRGPPRRNSGALAGELHMGRHLCTLCPRRGGARQGPGRRTPPRLSPGHDRLPGRACPADGLAAGAGQRRHGRQPRPRPTQGASRSPGL